MASRACGINDEHMFASTHRIPDCAVAPAILADRSSHPNGWVGSSRAPAAVAAYQHLSPGLRARLTPSVLRADKVRVRHVGSRREVAVAARR